MNGRSIYLQMLQPGEIVHIVDIISEWWLVIRDSMMAEVFKRKEMMAPIESVGNRVFAPLVRDNFEFHLFGNDGISSEAIAVVSARKVSAVPTQ